jgi:hypothetical protein
MNKRIILAELAKIANELDKNNLFSEANDVTKVMNDVGKKKGGGGFFDQPGVMGGPRFPHVDEIMDNWGVWFPKPHDYNGFDGLNGSGSGNSDDIMTTVPEYPKPQPSTSLPSESEEMGSSSMNAVVERSLDEDVIVRYPGPRGKRHIIEWNVKTPAWPGQEIVVDWETNRLKRILDTDEYQKRQNVEMMKSPKNMDR